MSEPSDEFTVTVPGGLLKGWRAGSGPPVLILHGGPGLSEYTSPLADELVGEFTVHRYQQRGLTPSTTDGPFTVDTHASDVLAVIDAMGDEPPFLVGHSWGGYLAMRIVAGYPERLRGLVVVDPLGATGDGGEADMGRIMDERIPPQGAARAAELDERAMRGEGSAGDAMEALSIVWPAYFPNPDQVPPMPVMTLSLACYSETWDSIHRELGAQTLAKELGRFRAPTVFVLGGGARSHLDTVWRRRPSFPVPRQTSSTVAGISRGWIDREWSERRCFPSNPVRRSTLTRPVTSAPMDDDGSGAIAGPWTRIRIESWPSSFASSGQS